MGSLLKMEKLYRIDLVILEAWADSEMRISYENAAMEYS